MSTVTNISLYSLIESDKLKSLHLELNKVGEFYDPSHKNNVMHTTINDCAREIISKLNNSISVLPCLSKQIELWENVRKDLLNISKLYETNPPVQRYGLKTIYKMMVFALSNAIHGEVRKLNNNIKKQTLLTA